MHIRIKVKYLRKVMVVHFCKYGKPPTEEINVRHRIRIWKNVQLISINDIIKLKNVTKGKNKTIK